MKPYFILKRSFFAFLFLFTVLTVLISGEFLSCTVKEYDGDTHRKRIEFIESLGYSANENLVETEKVKIPYVFSEVYENYNSLQLSAGYDLKIYCGCEAVRYTYPLLNPTDGGPTRVNLLVFNGKIIGGDISSAELDGVMLPLEKS